jgi:RNA polymerase sigma-70 factor (ECF subfamily)
MNPERETAARELAARAQVALAAMSHRKREAFVLVALEGLSGEEAATLLDIPVATVWTRLHHARRELRSALSEEVP